MQFEKIGCSRAVSFPFFIPLLIPLLQLTTYAPIYPNLGNNGPDFIVPRFGQPTYVNTFRKLKPTNPNDIFFRSTSDRLLCCEDTF